MRNLRSLLRREPAALGSLVASLIPALVLLGVLPMNEEQMAAVVVAVNATVGFAVRLAVTPVLAADGLAAEPQRGAGERERAGAQRSPAL
jgi:hypothetical protein